MSFYIFYQISIPNWSVCEPERQLIQNRLNNVQLKMCAYVSVGEFCLYVYDPLQHSKIQLQEMNERYFVDIWV